MHTPDHTTRDPARLDEWAEAALGRAARAWHGVRRAVHGIRRTILGGESEAEAQERGERMARENEARQQRQQARRERRAKARRAAGRE